MRNQPENGKKKNILPLMLCSCFPAFMFCVYAPYSLYFSNAEEFPFTFSDFWWIPLLCFAAAALILILPGLLLKKRKIYCAVLFAIGFGCWLQGSILFQDLGTFNGLPYDSSANLQHIVTDAIVWGLVIFVCVLLACAEKGNGKVFPFASAAFICFLAVTTVLLIFSARDEYLTKADSFVSDQDLLSVSEQDNIIVIVPDMFDSSYLDAILDAAPEELSPFEGFTYFRNATGCFSSTTYALGSFLSGGPMLNSCADYRATLNENYTAEKLFHELVERDYNIGIYTEGKFIPHTLAEKTVNCAGNTAGIVHLPRFISTLYRMTACTYAPDFFRPFTWLYGNEFDGLYSLKDGTAEAYTTDNLVFYSDLSENGLRFADAPCFRLIHIYGAHYPYIMDENLQPTAPSYSDENAVHASRGVLKILGEYIQALKESGVYDSTMIILMADHGYSIEGGLTNPLLMVKPFGADGDFCINTAPVSQADVIPTIQKAIGMELSGGESSLFDIPEDSCRIRYFYQLYDNDKNGQCRLVEWQIAPEGNERKYFTPTDREISSAGVISKHSDTCTYCAEHGLCSVDVPNSESIMH